MFVQHMLASLKPDGHMATIMPHGVLFRGGKEKLIRELFINDDVIEAIISLPPGLFYGTGIPACVLVLQQEQARRAARTRCCSSMPTANTPRARPRTSCGPRTSRRSTSSSPTSGRLPKYSRLVDKAEIVETHDYNLNIRRYVDNTPDPEPEDVQAHLIGGIPEAEVEARAADFARFGIKPETLFQPERPGYLAFRAGDRRQARHQGHPGSRPRAPADPRRPPRRPRSLVGRGPRRLRRAARRQEDARGPPRAA